MLEPYSGITATALGPVTWRKASASNTQGNCVELAQLPHALVAIRDSKDPAGPALVFAPADIAALVAGIRAGDYDQHA